MLKGKKGFTLIELLIVIVIIGILAGIVVGVVGTSSRKKANDAKKKSTVHEIQNALEQYFVDNNAYPAAVANLTTTDPPLLGSTVDTASYTYTPANTNTTYTLSFVLENQGDSGYNVTGTSPAKAYTVTNKQ